jgi:hypothetical protein
LRLYRNIPRQLAASCAFTEYPGRLPAEAGANEGDGFVNYEVAGQQLAPMRPQHGDYRTVISAVDIGSSEPSTCIDEDVVHRPGSL